MKDIEEFFKKFIIVSQKEFNAYHQRYMIGIKATNSERLECKLFNPFYDEELKEQHRSLTLKIIENKIDNYYSFVFSFAVPKGADFDYYIENLKTFFNAEKNALFNIATKKQLTNKHDKFFIKFHIYNLIDFNFKEIVFANNMKRTLLKSYGIEISEQLSKDIFKYSYDHYDQEKDNIEFFKLINIEDFIVNKNNKLSIREEEYTEFLYLNFSK